MGKNIVIETDRLILRHWLESDLEPFICMNKDSEVMHYYTHILEPEQTEQFYKKILEEFSEYGYGLYAVEEKCSDNFIGYIGFHRAKFEIDFCPCVEIGWRLDKEYWGKGYATEGAKACLKHGFMNLGLNKVYSFTTVVNMASQKVMQKIGMKLERYFDHPGIPQDHPYIPHVCYWVENK